MFKNSNVPIVYICVYGLPNERIKPVGSILPHLKSRCHEFLLSNHYNGFGAVGPALSSGASQR